MNSLNVLIYLSFFYFKPLYCVLILISISILFTLFVVLIQPPWLPYINKPTASAQSAVIEDSLTNPNQQQHQRHQINYVRRCVLCSHRRTYTPWRKTAQKQNTADCGYTRHVLAVLLYTAPRSEQPPSLSSTARYSNDRPTVARPSQSSVGRYSVAPVTPHLRRITAAQACDPRDEKVVAATAAKFVASTPINGLASRAAPRATNRHRLHSSFSLGRPRADRPSREKIEFRYTFDSGSVSVAFVRSRRVYYFSTTRKQAPFCNFLAVRRCRFLPPRSRI